MNVGRFLDNLSIVLQRHDFPPQNIWKIDETSIKTVETTQPSCGQAWGETRRGAYSTSAELGTLGTLALAGNVEFMNFCRSNGIALLLLPPQCSHKMQPLDRTVYGPFKKAVNNAKIIVSQRLGLDPQVGRK